MSQKRAIFSLIAILCLTPKPFQSDLDGPLIVQAAVSQDLLSGLYLQTMIQGGLAEERLQDLLDNGVNQTSEGIEVLRLIWMNINHLKPNQLLQLYGKLVELSAAPKALTNLQLEFAGICNSAITERAFRDDSLLSTFAARILQDIEDLSRTKFNKFVALPFLTAPKTTDVSIVNIVKPENSINFLPFYLVQGTQTSQKLIETSIIPEKDITMVQKHFEALIKLNTGKHLKSTISNSWERVYATQPSEVIQSSAQFEKFAKAIQNRRFIFIIMQIKSESEEFTVGYFTNQETPKFEIDYNQDTMCTLIAKKHDFVLYSSPKHSAILSAKELPNDSNLFMTVYTDYADSAFVQFFSSFQVSFSNQSKSYFFNSLDPAVNIQNQAIKEHFQTLAHKDIELKRIEVWTCGQGQFHKPVATKSNLSRSQAKKLPFCKFTDAQSLAAWKIKFAVPSNLTLGELRNKIGIADNTKFVRPSLVEGVANFTVIEDSQKVDSTVDEFGQLYLREQQILSKSPAQVFEASNFRSQISGMGVKLGNFKALNPFAIQNQNSSLFGHERKDASLERDTVSSEQISEQLYPGFTVFSELKNSRQALISAALLELQQYQKPSVRELLTNHLNEVQGFSKLTNDYLLHYLDKKRLEDVIQIIEHKSEMEKATDDDVKKIRSQMRNNFCHALNVLNQELKRKPDLVGSFLTLGVFDKLTEKVGEISGEFRRKKVSEIEPPEQSAFKPVQKRKNKVEIIAPIEKIEKKGVGYTTAVGQLWDVDAYLLKKIESASIITQIIQILEECVKNGNFNVESCEKLKIQLIESSLLPTLESAFRSGSLLEMAKEMDLYLSYLQLTLTLGENPSLFEVLLEISDIYEPRQKDSIFDLVKQAAGLAEIFLTCMTNATTDVQKQEDIKEGEKPKKLAEKFVEVYSYLQKKVTNKNKQSELVELQQLIEMPLEEAHRLLCKPLRFKYMNMEKGTTKTVDHYFQNQSYSNTNPPTKKLIRLAQEIADLTNSLPAEHTSSVFCRVAQKKVDFMKCLIMGAEGTPYAHGAFVYDVYFSDQYPEVPPKVQLITTGGGTIRFNPNLYAEGKVCLSLLGTWRGQSTENWDAKVSTVLQVLLSIQAIIMSNEVYFNEPGHEQELGTPNGEKLNRGYSNIVRYGNAKFAILEQLRNPTKGFEDAIKASFFLKKVRIIADIQQWIEEETNLGANQSSYGGLVMGHNAELAKQFGSKDESQSYLTKLKDVLEEIKAEFELLKSPYHVQVETNKIDDDADEKTLKRSESRLDLLQHSDEDVDMIFESEITQSQNQVDKKIDINDEKVKDRWSRYIGAMGIESVAKQAEAVVFLSGLGATGVEISKNIVLAGCKELILYDTQMASVYDLAGQFFLTNEDVMKSELTRAEISKIKLQQLNTYVKVTLMSKDLKPEQLAKELVDRKVRVAVFTDSHKVGFQDDELIKINEIIREAKIPMILADQSGLFSRILNDFGENHIVTDLTGDEILDVMIQQISFDENQAMLVKTIQNHGYQDGDIIRITQVVGLEITELLKIEVIDVKQFQVKQPVGVSGVYQHNGIARLVKIPKQIVFDTIGKVFLDLSDVYIDKELKMMDFEKLENQHWGSIAFKLIENYPELDSFVERAMLLAKNQKSKPFFEAFFKTRLTSFGPLAAYVGGIVGQEIVKVITQKFKPIHHEVYLDVFELYSDQPNTDLTSSDSLITCFGEDFVQRIKKTNLFMIGAGAIGCELLKNFAMLGLGSQGQITLTDPDVIEVSNLNRQFLFREKHLRKPKSHTAAAAAILMNPAMKGHISARLDKVHNDTSEIYNEEFFQQQDIVANALDNVAARVYVDNKCLSARTMLVDSGTLGPKGHVQVICPFKTENYAAQEDAQDNNEIPHCTLKMFPEETLHCVEWAKDFFGQTFTLSPKNFNKLLETPLNEIEFENQTELRGIQKTIKMALKTQHTHSFEDLVMEARQKFQKLFHDNILQLVHVYPLDKLTAEGRPFWALPKRPPRPLTFDSQNEVHRSFVAAYACLLARMRRIEIPGISRTEEFKQLVADEAQKFVCKPFVPNDAKAQEIESQVNKQNQRKEDLPSQKTEITIDTTTNYHATSIQNLKESYQNVMLFQKSLTPTEFEKDVDSNFHIDFIHATANARAQNYELPAMDWITVKIKAGKIVPALATTTATIAALQTIEILKLLKVKDGKMKISETRNTFLNTAGPYMMMSEPGEPVTNKLTADISVTVWDRWEVKIDKVTGTLADVISHLDKLYKIKPRDVFMGAQPLFLYAIRNPQKSLAEQDEFKCTLVALLKEKTDMLAVQKWVDLTLTFVATGESQDEKMLENVPTVRVLFK